MRGKGDCTALVVDNSGITPAYAGKRRAVIVDPSAASGSPPPMRGKVVSPAQHVRRAGITPAYAGKRFPMLSS